MYVQNKNALKCLKMFAITTTITTTYWNVRLNNSIIREEMARQKDPK